jgi:hypothetical protein
MTMIPVGPWTPDTPDFMNEGSLEALNVIPAARSYRPFPGFAAISNALNARAQGAFFARRSDGTGTMFAGDATRLYKLAAGSWSDVSRVAGGAYSCPADGVWSFAQFGSLVLAFNGVDAPQQFNIDGDANFSAMSGAPPIARYAAVVGDFVMTGNQNGAPNRVQWGPIDNNGAWTPSQATEADSQDLPDGGWIQGIVGFDQSGTIFQEFCIRRLSYVGTPLVFQFGKIADNIGATIPGSIAPYKERIFFCDRSGFYMLLGGYVIQPIGDQRVNQWFWNRLDQNDLVRVTSAIDPVNSLYAIAFPDASAANGNPNNLLIYCWSVDRWAHVSPGALEMIFSGATQSGWTLEQLDVYGTLEQVPFSLDSVVWTGIARRLVAGFDASHRLGFFNGPALAPTVDTTEAAPGQGRLARLRSARPLVDGGTPSLVLGTRNRQMDAVSWSPAVAVNPVGSCPLNTAARYVRGRITLPAGQSWTHILGLDDLDIAAQGRQ